MNLMVIFMYATLFILFRNLRFWLVVAYNQAEACIHYFILGMISLLLKMDPWGAANDIYLLNLFGNLIFLILSFSFGMAVRKRRDAIHERLKQIKQRYYFLFFILFTIPVFTYTNSSTRPQDVAADQCNRLSAEWLFGYTGCGGYRAGDRIAVSEAGFAKNDPAQSALH